MRTERRTSIRDYIDNIPWYVKTFIVLICAFLFGSLMISAGFVGAIGIIVVIGILSGFVFFIVHDARRNRAHSIGMMTDDPSFPASGTHRSASAQQDEEAGRAPVFFKDIVGCEDAILELKEPVEFLANPDRFLRLGARVPTGYLLKGPPGTGKTMLGRAMANEAKVPFFYMNGSEFDEKLVGVGASRVRDLFDDAKKAAPAIVFIDEVDGIEKRSSLAMSAGQGQTIAALLVELDGFDTNDNVIFIATTNRPDMLDPALLRAGRIDRHITVDNPDFEARLGLLELYTKNKPLDKDVNLEEIARQAIGRSGADMENIANEAAILAVRRDADNLSHKDFEAGIDRVLTSIGATSHKVSDKEKEIIAHHEAGHAVAAFYCEGAYLPHKITIVSSGQMGGYTHLVPEEENYLQTRKEMKAQIAALYGGLAAEELFFGDDSDGITTGAYDDIAKATELAHVFVTKLGAVTSIGLINVSTYEKDAYLGGVTAAPKELSEEMKRAIENEMRQIAEEAHQRARTILEEHHDEFETFVAALIEKETMDFDEINKVLGSPRTASS